VYVVAWQYPEPLFLMPIRLPFLRGIAALFVKRLTAIVVTWV
jgi:hypothetical protein